MQSQDRSSLRARRALLLGPAFSWWLVLLVAPVVLILAYSVFRRGIYGGVVYEATFENFERLFDGLYLRVVWFSVRVALETTVLALLIGYPVAWFIATRPVRWRTVLLVLIVLPFWTSMLIRTYAWMALLNDEGLINNGLEGIGLIDRPLKLLYNEFAIVLGMLYSYLPLMVLPLYAAIERLPSELREASQDLGAGGWRTFRTVTPRAAGRRTAPDGRQPDPGAVPGGARLALRGDARARRDGADGRLPVRPGEALGPRPAGGR